jgi:hypothetical protein
MYPDQEGDQDSMPFSTRFFPLKAACAGVPSYLGQVLNAHRRQFTHLPGGDIPLADEG